MSISERRRVPAMTNSARSPLKSSTFSLKMSGRELSTADIARNVVSAMLGAEMRELVAFHAKPVAATVESQNA